MDFTKISNKTAFNPYNKKMLEHQISISCDTDDWSNNAENSSLPSHEKKKNRKQLICNNISQ